MEIFKLGKHMEYTTLIFLFFEFSTSQSSSEEATTRNLASQDTLATKLTQALLQNIIVEQEITEKYCFLQVLFEERSQTPLLMDWTLVSQFSQPLQYFLQFTNKNISSFHYTPPMAKYKSSCWQTVVTIRTLEFSRARIKIGHPAQDHYVFLSARENLLLNVMSSASVLNSFSRKYGIFLESSSSSIGYITEPSYYTGHMITQSSVKIQKVINNYNGRRLRAGYLQIPPFFYSEGDYFDGLQYNLIVEIAKRTNHSISFYGDLKRPGFGRRMPNGTWTGLVGELIAGRADMATTLGPMLNRKPFVDNARSSYIDPLVMCLKSPQAYRHWHALIDPLKPFVWLCTFLMFVTNMISLLFQVGILSNSRENWGKISIEIFLGIFGIFLEQSTFFMERRVSRLLLIVWILFAYWIGTAYKSNLVTFLTFSEADKVPESFKELHDDPSYSVILHSAGGLELDLLRKSRNPVLAGIGAKMFLSKDVSTCLKSAITSRTACIGWEPFMTSAMGKDVKGELRSLFISKNWGSYIWSGSAFRKGSIFTDAFSRYVEIARGPLC